MTDEQMLATYRHDAHKMTGRAHENAPEEWFGVSVNADVPYGADGDAAAMSRPNGKPEQVLHDHETHYRRSLTTGNTKYDEQEFNLQAYGGELKALLATDDAEKMHLRWLADDVVSGFNESVYYPYTSLKYHTLLVGALVDCYRNGMEFDDLGLWIDTDARITPYRTVFTHEGSEGIPAFTLRIDSHSRGESSKLSSYPMRNFASVWKRAPFHPWTDSNKQVILWLDAQLRRIRAWSTALQYLETATTEVNTNA